MDSPDSYRGKFPELFYLYFVYVIESLKGQSFYIGKTSDLDNRLVWHSSEEFYQGVTKRKIPWKYFYALEVDNSRIAGKIEKHIKKMKSRKCILNLEKYPEIAQKLIERYS